MPPLDLSRRVVLVVCVLLGLPVPVGADPVRIANGAAPIVSGSGRFVAFVSTAADLVPNDTNGVADVFVHDRDADGDGVFDEPGGTSIERVSVATGGAQANAAADFRIDLSPDGRYVVFASASTNLVTPPPGGGEHVYRHDRATGATRLVSSGPLAVDERFVDPTITTDGRYVTFLRQRGAPDVLPFPGSQHLARGTQACLVDLDSGAQTAISEPLPADDERHRWVVMAPRVNAGGTHAIFTIHHTEWHQGQIVATDASVAFRDLPSGASRTVHTYVPAADISDDGRVVALVAVPYGVRFLDVETGRIDGASVTAFHQLADDGVRLSGNGRVAYGKCYRMFRVPNSPWVFYPVECLFDRDTLQAFPFGFTDHEDTNGSWGTLSHDGRFLAFAGQGTGSRASVLDLDAHFDVAGLDARWKQAVGLGVEDGPDGDADGDGRTNLEEFHDGGLPRGGTSAYFAEGAGGPYFGASFALVNPASESALVSLRHLGQTTVKGRLLTVPALSRRTIDAVADGSSFPGAFGTVVEAGGAVTVERTMRWEGGGHSQTGLAAASPSWSFAEGSTSDPFELFYLLANPGPAPVSAAVTFLRPHGASPITARYDLPAASRTTVHANENAALRAAPSDVAVFVDATAPIVVERAMYLRAADGTWRGGTASGGAAAPATTWHFAEGATGPFFETFLALANPSSRAADIEVRFFAGQDESLAKSYVVPALTRTTVWIDELEFPGRGKALAAADVAMVVTSTNDVPMVAERMMWWPGGSWSDGHSSLGAVSPARRWVVADGTHGGPHRDRTYLLVANAGVAAVDVDVTLLLEDDTKLSRRLSVGARRRLTLDVAALFPELPDGVRFGAIVASTDAAAALVVERSTYWDAHGTAWAAGAGTPATPVP